MLTRSGGPTREYLNQFLVRTVVLRLLLFLSIFLLSSIVPRTVQSETAPGTIDGQLSVNLNGSSSYTLPLSVPSGAAGMAPKLFLSYDSNSGPGQFGLGWSLSGASSISRINRTAFIDGHPEAVLFDDTLDAVSLDGARLVSAPEGGPYLAKSVDDQTRVWRQGQGYVAKTKAGLTLYFGETEDSRIKTSGGKVLTWALSRIEDTFGNQIIFLYVQRDGDWGIKKVFWTVPRGRLSETEISDEGLLQANSFASLEVEYLVAGTVYSFGFVGGQKTARSLLAERIVVRSGNEEFRRYEFAYDVTNRYGARRLKSIREVGANLGAPRLELPLTQFTYTDFEPRWSKAIDYGLPEGFGSYRSLRSGYRVLDLDGDGDRDLLYSAYLDGRSFRRGFRQEPQLWTSSEGLAPPIDFSSGDGEADAVFFFDTDGDRRPELFTSRLVEGQPQSTAHFLDVDTWKVLQGLEPPFAVVEDGRLSIKTFATHLNGSPQLLAWDSQGSVNAWAVVAGGWKAAPVAGWPEQGMPSDVFEGDFNCDGQGDLAIVSGDRLTLRFFQKAADANGSLELSEIGSYLAKSEISIARQSERNGCNSVVIGTLSPKTVQVISISSSGLVEAQQVPLKSDQLDRLTDVLLLDADGSGSDEISVLLSYDGSKPNISTFRYDEQLGTWSLDELLGYSASSLADAVDETYLVVVEDIDDDQREDFVLLPTESGVSTKALVNKASGFSLVADFVPPIEFAREEKVGASPQFVDLNADGLTDVVGFHLDKDGKEVLKSAHINVKSGWVPAEELELPMPITHEKGGAAGAFVDFNSDGIADFVYAYGAEDSWGAWTVEFDGSGNALRWVKDLNYKLPSDARLSDPENGDMGVRFMDLNGDGRVDILIARRPLRGPIFSKAYLNTGTGWGTAPDYFKSPVPFVSRERADVHYETKVGQGEYYRDLQVLTLDINGDGLSDLLFRYGHMASPTGSTTGMGYAPGKDGCMNVDKMVPGPKPNDPPVEVKHPIPSSTQCAGVYLGSVTGWKQGSDAFLPPVPLDLNIDDPKATIDFSDLNGDGLVDIAPTSLSGGTNTHPAYMNTGTSWVSEPAFSVPAAALSADKRLTGHRLLDLNGDGLVDIAYSRPGGAKGAFFNTGTGWAKAADEYAPPEPFVNEKGEDQGVRFVDVDGNGLPDALRSYRDKSGALTQSAFLNSGDTSKPEQAIESRADILKTVDNGMGLVTIFEYRSLISPRTGKTVSGDDFYTPSPVSPFPSISYVPTMYAVEQMSFVDTDGSRIATKYFYKGFRFDVPAAAVLGFEERIAKSYVNDEASGVEEHVQLFQDFFRVGRSKRETAIIDDIRISETENLYELVEAAPAVWPKRLVLSETSSATRDLNGDETGSTRQFFTYDEYNNATKTCVEYGDGSLTLTDNEFDDAADITVPSVLYLGRLVMATVSHVRGKVSYTCGDLLQGLSGVPPDEMVVNSAKFTYDIRRNASGVFDPASTGVLVTEVANFGHPLAVTKTYRHDEFGNVIREVVETADTPARTKETKYDPSGRFVIEEINALGHSVTYEYSYLLGLPLTVTDPNGVMVENDYDGLGKLVTAKSPTGLVSVDLRQFEGSVSEVLGRPVAFKQVQKTGDILEVTTYFDKQGRVLRTVRFGRKGGSLRKIFQDYKYDARGRLVAESLPYFEGDPVYFGKTEYDSLDRATRTEAPDGSITSVSFAGLTTVMTDASGKTSTVRVNKKGLTVETIDAIGGSLGFVYGPGDRLLKTVQVDGLELVHGYDEVGNKVLSIDPDLGRWDYRYNGFGEIVWQRDAKGQVTTISYDALGRPVSRHMPDKLDAFEYDLAAFGIGKPSRVSSSDGYEELFTYDRYGRVDRKATRVEGELYSTSVVYDDYDRPIEVYYPGNYVVTNDYDDQLGFLVSVSANDPLKPFLGGRKTYWTAVERDQYGRILTEVLGNGITSTYAYDPLKGSLDAISARAEDETQITDIALKYDVIGNLLSKVHRTEERTEEFSYDSLDRLAKWNINGKTKGRYTYDAVGRILTKSDMGEYSYEGDGPAHAVKRVVKPDGTEAEYQYDANGNMVFGPKGHFEYYANNTVKLIYKSKDAWSRFSYAPDGSRYRQHYSETRPVGKSGSVTNVLVTVSIGAYENIRDLGGPFIVKPGGFERHRLYLAAEGGVVAVLEHSTEFEPLINDPKFKAGKEGTPLAIALSTTSASYLHKDELGSILKVTNEDGAVISGYTHDPWGKKTQVDWVEKGKKDFADGTFRRGFTGHEHLDNLELIHMNGRVYDPDLARFVSADPTIQYPTLAQNYDRYSYVVNNPLRYVDETGFGFFKKLWKAATKPFEKAWAWVEKNWKQIVVVAAVVVVGVLTAGTGVPAIIMMGAAMGATAGGLTAALYGGNFGDVVFGTLKGGLFGATGAAFGYALGPLGAGLVGGLEAESTGGNFGKGFASAAFSKWAGGSKYGQGVTVKAIIQEAAIGGTKSVIGGGKFANGAILSSFGAALSASMTGPKNLDAAPSSDGSGGAVPRAFVGGFFDRTMGIFGLGPVYSEFQAYRKSGGDAVYFTWDETDALADWIGSNPGGAVMAHSYGADTAASVVAAGNRVGFLFTADPVSWLRPEYADIGRNATTWVNVDAQGGSSWSFDNIVAGVGGAWNAAPSESGAIHRPSTASHANFAQMCGAIGGCR